MSEELLPPCRYCKYMESMEQIKCADNCSTLGEFNDYVKQSIAARDKEWVEWIERWEVGSETNPGWKSISPDEWQKRKRSIGL